MQIQRFTKMLVRVANSTCDDLQQLIADYPEVFSRFTPTGAEYMRQILQQMLRELWSLAKKQDSWNYQKLLIALDEMFYANPLMHPDWLITPIEEGLFFKDSKLVYQPNLHSPYIEALLYLQDKQKNLIVCERQGCTHPYFIADDPRGVKYCTKACTQLARKAWQQERWRRKKAEIDRKKGEQK